MVIYNLNRYQMVKQGICRVCNKPLLEWEHQQGWRCKRCGFVYLADDTRKCVVEPDCQNGK